MVVKFEKGRRTTRYSREISYKERSEEGQPMYESLINSNTQSIISAFDVKAWGKDKKSSIIDVTDLFNSDNGELFSTRDPRRASGSARWTRPGRTSLR